MDPIRRQDVSELTRKQMEYDYLKLRVRFYNNRLAFVIGASWLLVLVALMADYRVGVNFPTFGGAGVALYLLVEYIVEIPNVIIAGVELKHWMEKHNEY